MIYLPEHGLDIASKHIMKILKLIFLTGLSLFAYSNEFTYVIGGLTPHYQTPEEVDSIALCNEVKPGSGVIYNELYSLRYTYGRWSTGALVGENSYCKPIWGMTQSYYFYRGKRLDFGATVGFYHFDEDGFDFSKGAYFSKIGDFYFVPIVGLEFNYTLYYSRNFRIRTMNLFTPVISNHSIGLVLDF